MIPEEFYDKLRSGKLAHKSCDPEQKTVNARDIIIDENWNPQKSKDFWNHHGHSKEEYIDFVRSGEADKLKPIDVYKCNDKYVLVADGNHRVAAAQELDVDVKVNVTGEYYEKGQQQDKTLLSPMQSTENDNMGKISSQLNEFRREYGEPGLTSPAAHEHQVTPEIERERIREQIQDNQLERLKSIEQQNA